MPKQNEWIVSDQPPVPEEFQTAIGGHPLVAQILYQRGYQDIAAARAFLDPNAYQPTPAEELPDLKKACDLLVNALDLNQRIFVWGDFDVDGQTATTILVEGLRRLGADPIFHIPVRAKESHGISEEVLTDYFKLGFDLLITCDTGIGEHRNIQRLRDYNIPVIVTDHHTLGETLPPANAVVNPQRLPAGHPLHTLPGAGVAFKLLEGLFATQEVSFDSGHFLELVALGIVADVAILQGDTRYLLQKGLMNLRHTRRIGLQSIYEHANLDAHNLNEDHIGFQIAPRLNAVGRLGDANMMVEFLTTQDMARARILATQIEAHNARRRSATRQVEMGAENQLQTTTKDRYAPAIVLHHPGWPAGVVGIVANRLAERYKKPVILLTGEDPVHGSARSVKGLNITKAIASQENLLLAYGGHPMAAGLSLPAEYLPRFKRNFHAEITQRTKSIAVTHERMVHQVLTVTEITLDLIKEISRLSPFGPGNPPLNFIIKDLKLLSVTTIGQHGEHRQMIVLDDAENQLRLVWWNGGDEPLPEGQFDLVCKLTQTDYEGTPQISAEWVDYRLSEIGIQQAARRQFMIIDHRSVPSPQKVLSRLIDTLQDFQTWGEGPLSDAVQAIGRHQLKVGGTLIIWTAPPSQSVLQEVIQLVKPDKIVLFGINSPLNNAIAFISYLVGLLKYAIHHKQSQAQIGHLASACAAEQGTVCVGLQLLQAMGKFQVEFKQDHIFINKIDTAPNKELIQIHRESLNMLITETQAYRHYFKSSDIHSIFPHYSEK